MTVTAPAGNVVSLNLGPRHSGPGNLLPLNLGVPWDGDDPTPPDPVVRGLRTATQLRWQQSARPYGRTARLRWGSLPALRYATRVPWARSAYTRAAWRMPWADVPRQRRGSGIAWRGCIPQEGAAARLPWAGLPTQRRAAGMRWRARLARAAVDAALPWHSPPAVSRGVGVAWRARLAAALLAARLRWLHPGQQRRDWRIPWGEAPLVPWIVRPPEPPTPPEPEPEFPPGNRVGLHLGCPVIDVPGLAPLNLGVTACYAVRPQRRTYIVLNTVTVVRLPDLLPIEVDSLSITQGADAWCAAFDLSLADPSQLALLKPTASGPREVQITLNGYVWTAIVESYGSRREFVAGGVTLAGRSRTALLGAPYAPLRTKVTTAERSAAQLVDEELASTGYTADFESPDWLVAAGGWYYDGLTPMDAIVRVAEAAGAVVQSDPAALSLRVRPRYPASPWVWPDTTPDVIVYDEIVTSETLQLRTQPLYDAVVVTGEIAGKGVTARVKRSGEAGTLYAPQASHPLIATAGVATERGRNILSDRGEQAAIDYTLPLFPAPVAEGTTGRVQPLDLVEMREASGTWQGLCTAVRIDARLDNQAWVIEQTISLERHYSDAN